MPLKKKVSPVRDHRARTQKLRRPAIGNGEQHGGVVSGFRPGAFGAGGGDLCEVRAEVQGGVRGLSGLGFLGVRAEVRGLGSGER